MFASTSKVAEYQAFLPTIVKRWPIFATFVGTAYLNGETIDIICNPSSIILGPAEFAGEDLDLVLKLHMGAEAPDNIQLFLNGTAIETARIDKPSMTMEFSLNGLNLYPDKANWLTFYFLDQAPPQQNDGSGNPPSIKALSIERAN